MYLNHQNNPDHHQEHDCHHFQFPEFYQYRLCRRLPSFFNIYIYMYTVTAFFAVVQLIYSIIYNIQNLRFTVSPNFYI